MDTFLELGQRSGVNGQAPPVHLSPWLTQAARPLAPARNVWAVAAKRTDEQKTG